MGHRELTKVRVLAHRDSVTGLLEGLQSYGSFHPIDFEEPHDGTERHKNSEVNEARDRLDSLVKAIELLEPYRQKGSFLDEALPARAELQPEDRERLLKDMRPFKVAREVSDLDKERAQYQKENEQLLARADALILSLGDH